ncbi:hypothetical protein BJY52DRAFT_1195241 [Lactarius psammicola]|nr:hypothetical protein BJY52DRAFT_1195241 [Lactarius psammicola]
MVEGPFDDQGEAQISKLARNISLGRQEQERAPSIPLIRQRLAVEDRQIPLYGDVVSRREAFSVVFEGVKGLGEGTDHCLFNISYAHIKPMASQFSRNHIVTSTTTESTIKYRIFTNLFNTLPRQSALHLPVYDMLLNPANTNDELHVLHIPLPNVEM